MTFESSFIEELRQNEHMPQRWPTLARELYVHLLATPQQGRGQGRTENSVFSYRAQSAATTTTTPTRTPEGSGTKTTSYKDNQSKVVKRSGRGIINLATTGTSTSSTLASPYKRTMDRPSALVSPLTLLERSRSNNVRVSHLRLNPATVGAPRSLLKKPPPPLPSPPSPRPTSRQAFHYYLQPYAYPSSRNAMAYSDFYLRPPSGTSNKKSYTSSIHVHISPVASPITLDLRSPTCEQSAASASTSNAIPQSSEPHDPHLWRTHHPFASSHCPFNFMYEELQCTKGTMFPSTPTQSTKLSFEEAAFTDTEVPLPSPRITFEPLDERHSEDITSTKECVMWNNTCDVLANEVTMSNPHEEVFRLRLGGDNVIQQSKEMTNSTASSCRLGVVTLREGHVCEIVHPFSSLSSLAPLESLQKAALSLCDSTSQTAVDLTPRILIHKSVVRRTLPSHLRVETVIGNSQDLSVLTPGQPVMPPDRMTTPASPYLADDTIYFEALGNHSNAFRPEWSTTLETETEPGAISPLTSETKLTPQETIERINKLRSIIRVDESFYPLQLDKCVQVEQPAIRTLASWQTSKECQVDQLPSDLWDTVTISDTSTQSFNEHDVVPKNVVEDYGDCEPLPSCRSRPRPKENIPFSPLMAWQEQKLRRPSTKSVHRRRRTKVPALKMGNEVTAELTSGAPFLTPGVGRSMSVEEGRCPPPSEQGSSFSVNESSPPLSTLRWEDCINRVYARRRHRSASINAHVRSSRPKRTSRKPCIGDRKKQQDLKCSLMRQTFASAQRSKASHPS
ncbi:hypothetical protein TcWFU_005667 [Taenia crassiceps]|uniref:Uncharacterized protein n=1 Tax=Taenia crassiceps TaxID=6207 RepID=A0ABR4Q2P2_9CEST